MKIENEYVFKFLVSRKLNLTKAETNLVVKCIAAKFLYGDLKFFEQMCFLIKIKTCENFYLYSFRNNYFVQKILVSSN